MSYFKLSFALTFIILETRYNEIKKHRYTNVRIIICLYTYWIHYQSVSYCFSFFFSRKNNTFLLFFPSKFVVEGKLELLLGDWTGRPEINYLQPFRLNRWNSREGSRFNSKRNARGSLSIFVHWER